MAVTDGAGVGGPAPAEDGAIFNTSYEKRKEGTVAAVAAIDSSSRGAGREATGTGNGDDGTVGDGSATAFRCAVAAACEIYRAGVVLHQEAFLSSSTEKFLRVLELLEIATAEMKSTVVPQEHEIEPRDGTEEERVGLSRMAGGGGEECDDSGAGRLAGDRVGDKASSPSRGESFDGGAEVIRSMRVGCHLNIAAAFLLRKTDFESAVDHCTRYAAWGGARRLAVFPTVDVLVGVRNMNVGKLGRSCCGRWRASLLRTGGVTM